MFTHQEIREKFLKFFEKRGHKIIPSASLIPENDPSALFISAGMQPLVPYLLGESHPEGNRIANIQKCLRTTDIEEVGDSTHLTFFEMMGNWSLGDPDAKDGIGAGYFKEDSIKWSYELLTSKVEGFALDSNRIYITCFEGDENAPKDEESANIWQSVGIPKERIFFLPAESNWWPQPKEKDEYSGPCGPDTEIFYDLAPDGPPIDSKEKFKQADDAGRVVEIWNNVFMKYEKKGGKVVGELKQKNVDTGAGLERFATVLQEKNNVYETDLFSSVMDKIEELAPNTDLTAMRIVADHIRSAVFMIGDGVLPSNTDRGYILRRLLRRAVRNADTLGMSEGTLVSVARVVVNDYGVVYKNLFDKKEIVEEEIRKEEDKFRKTLEKGLAVLNKKLKVQTIKKGSSYELQEVKLVQGPSGIQMWDNIPPYSMVNGKWLFDFYQTFGFPFEMIIEELEKGSEDRRPYKFIKSQIAQFKEEFDEYFKKHQGASKTASAGKFKGGLSGTGEMETKYHTATHLLLAALKEVLGSDVEQRGSNITVERLRFDFSWPEKLTDEERQKVEDLVNQKISEKLPVSFEEVSLDEAKKMGAHGIFDEKYGEKVKVYKMGDFSLEICGGPHVKNTGELGKFKIKKEESSSSGIRRIKAVLE